MATGNDFNNSSVSPSSSFSISDWDIGIATNKEQQERFAGFHDELKSCFGYRTVSAILESETEKKLPEYTGRLPSDQEGKKLGTLRKMGRIMGLGSKPLTVFPKKLEVNFPEVPPAFEGEKALRESPAHIFVPDNKLAANLLPDEPVFIRTDKRAIFAGEPAPADVCQVDRRSTCYLLSALASYSASPIGKKVLKEMVHPAGEGYALVTFFDSATQENIQVMVSTDRLTDKNGRDVYSFNNPTRAIWAGIIEKAFHAYKLSRSEKLKEQIVLAKQQGDELKQNFLEVELHKIAPPAPRKSLLDRGNMFGAINCIPRIPRAIEQPSGTHYNYNHQSSVMLENLDVRNTNVKELLRFNIEMGVPVILGTHPSNSLTGSLRAVTTGTPTGHAVAVLGPAEILTGKKGQNLEDGVLIYDPYGIALDGGRELSDDSTVIRFAQMTGLSEKDTPPKTPEEEEETSFIPKSVPESSIERLESDDFEPVEQNDVGLLTKTAGHSVRFYTYEQLHRYFAKGTIAAGGYS